MNSKYDELYMSDEDLIQARGIDASIKNGVMSVEEGHGLKEEIRKKYGYSGGADGSEYIKLETKQSGFDAGKLLSALAGSGNQWDAPFEKAAREYTGMSYDDFTQGDDYASLAKRYSEQGQKAMNATLAEIAARTGGMASSYATTAAGQTYNDYMMRLEDAARSMYEGERADAAENLGVLQSMRDAEENRKQTLYGLAYQTFQDQKADARYAQEKEDARYAQEKEDAQNRIYNHIYAFGSAEGLDASVLAAAGYDTAYVSMLEELIAGEKAAQSVPKQTATVVKPTLSLKEAEAAYTSGNKSKNVLAALQYYYGDDYIDYLGEASKVDRTGDAYVLHYTEAYKNKHNASYVMSHLADAVENARLTPAEAADIADRLGLDAEGE